MFNGITEKITAQLISYRIIEHKDKQIYFFGIHLFLMKSLYTAVFLTWGYHLEIFTECMIFLCSFIYLRNYVGGFHASSNLICFCTTSWMVGAVIWLMKYALLETAIRFGWASSILSVAIIYIYAPMGTVKKLLDEAEVRVYRRKARFRTGLIFTLFVLCMFYDAVSYGFPLALSLISASFLLTMQVMIT